MAFVALAVVVRLARRGVLSFRYAIGWMIVTSLGILAGLFIPLTAPIAGVFGMTPAGLLAVVALIVFVAITIQLSISISGLQQQVRALAEELARQRHMIQTWSDHDN
jgi:hypothetical protein